jgi:yecA family protein
MNLPPSSLQIPDLSSADEAWLRQFLAAALPRAPDTLGLEELYGFLFAVASAPDLVLPSEWIPAIFDADGTVFADEAEGVRFHHVAMALYNQLNRDVQDANVRLPACVEVRRPAEANFAADAPLMLWSRGFAQGHDWLQEAWDVDLPEEVDDELGACLSALLFFIDPKFAATLLEESGQPPSELPALAQTLLDNFEGAMMGYAEIGRMVYEAQRATTSTPA